MSNTFSAVDIVYLNRLLFGARMPPSVSTVAYRWAARLQAPIQQQMRDNRRLVVSFVKWLHTHRCASGNHWVVSSNLYPLVFRHLSRQGSLT